MAAEGLLLLLLLLLLVVFMLAASAPGYLSYRAHFRTPHAVLNP
jgi:hypothetical protein